MTDAVTSVFASLVEGLPTSRRWIAFVFIVLLVVGALLLVEHQSGAGYYYALGRRTELLTKLNDLAVAGIGARAELRPVYLKTIEALDARPLRPLDLSRVPGGLSVGFWKFLSGASLGILLSLSLWLEGKGNLGGLLSGLTLSAVFGALAWLLPTAPSPWVNYLGFPLLFASVLWGASRRKRSAA